MIRGEADGSISEAAAARPTAPSGAENQDNFIVIISLPLSQPLQPRRSRKGNTRERECEINIYISICVCVCVCICILEREEGGEKEEEIKILRVPVCLEYTWMSCGDFFISMELVPLITPFRWPDSIQSKYPNP